MGTTCTTKKWMNIIEIMDELAVPGGEENVHKRIALAASMGQVLRPNEVFVAHEEITDIICHYLKIIGWLESWPKHIRKCVEQYDVVWFADFNNALLFYHQYKSFYVKVQTLALHETKVKLI